MLKTLLKKQMAEIFRTYLYDAKKNRKRSTASVILFFAMFVLLMVGVVGGMFTFLSIAICGPFAEAGMNWLYFTLMGLLAVFLGAFGSVFNTYAGLYLSKDNDLLLSMPIPVRTILTARLLSVYLMGLMYSGMVILPAAVVYWFVVPLTAGAVVGSLLLVFLISLIVLILSCALGWVVAKISLKLKNKSFITVLISLVFIGAYYFFYFKAQEMIQTLILNAAAYGEKIKGAAYPLYLFGRTGTGDWLAMLAVAAVVLALFALTWAVLARSFLKIATSTGHTKRTRYRETAARVRSPFRALLGKEFRRFGSSSAYMLNCGFGTLFLPVGGIALLWKGGRLFSNLNEIFDGSTGAIPVLVTAVVCMLAAMNFMVVPSVSLEGKNLWQLQSLPVKPWQVLRAKLAVQLTLTGIPALFCVVCFAVVYPCSPVQLVLMLAEAALFTALADCFGLVLGLKMPNLTWTNELAPIKQSFSVFAAMLGGWIYALAVGGGYFLLRRWLGAELYLALAVLVTAALTALCYAWLRGKGSRTFAAL